MILRNRLRHITLLLVAALGMANIAGCKDDLLDVSATTPGQGSDTEGIDLEFMVNLPREESTRAETYLEGNIDNHIDLSSVQVLFLDKDGNFLFRPPFDMTRTTDNNRWSLTVHLNNNIKGDNDVSILSNIKAQLERDNFKIAVLANWKENENSSFYALDWGWNNSYLNPAAKDKKSIHDLHHLKTDKYYSDRSSAYSFIMEGGKMGINSEWVKMRNLQGTELNGDAAWHANAAPDGMFNNTSTAYNWIKANWNPAEDNIDDVNTGHGIYRHYRKLWQLWNFGGSFSDNRIPYSVLGAEKFETQWQGRNGNEFAASTGSAQYWCAENGHLLDNGQTNDGLTVITAPNKTEGNENQYVRSFNGTEENNGYTGYYGLVLPKVNKDILQDYNPGTQSKNKPFIKTSSENAFEYLRFEVPGTGTLRVRFSSANENMTRIVVQRGANWEMTYETTGRQIKEIGANNSNNLGHVLDPDAEKVGYVVKITGDAEPIIIYCLEGSAIIYSIDYVCDDYLNGTDREGIIPTESYPIPMYGVQEFPKIEAWGSQKVLDLSQGGARDIGLIRSLAKVELYLPVGVEISHVYLRSMNRKARCEPMDVSGSTSGFWKGHTPGDESCEWFTIQKYGSGYKAGNFQNWYKWFYGSWSSWWDLSKGEKLTSADEEPGTSAETLESPHLFNPDVERSDFCHFIKDNKYNDGFYHRYILYVPDKAISDPNTVNNLESSPKVCHIEYRKSTNSEYLDDNDCYRIYFTDYATNTAIREVKKDQYESKYETSENLEQHWPIMRNHIYRFYVGAENTPQEIRVKVVDWGTERPAKEEVW